MTERRPPARHCWFGLVQRSRAGGRVPVAVSCAPSSNQRSGRAAPALVLERASRTCNSLKPVDRPLPHYYRLRYIGIEIGVVGRLENEDDCQRYERTNWEALLGRGVGTAA